MDGLSDDAKQPEHVYRLHEKSLYAMDLMHSDTNSTNNNTNNTNNNNNNNNNNEKMNDANNLQNISDATQDNESLGACYQSNNVIQHERCHENGTDQSDASDEQSDNNSTDNISFVSEDLVDNIIILPSSFLSDDEQSTNSDDCVYAYRGAGGFEPVNDDVNADEETDYLEMDFDPDPVSEVEREDERRQFNGPSNMAAVNLGSNIAMSLPAYGECSADQRYGGKDASQDSLNRQSMSRDPKSMENNGIFQCSNAEQLLAYDNNNKMKNCCNSNECDCMNNMPSTSAGRSGGLPTKKYTGTIPKSSNRYHSRLQQNKPSTSTSSETSHTAGIDSVDVQNGSYIFTSKRSKNDIENNSPACNGGDTGASTEFRRICSAPSPSRSMSFPGEMFLSQADSHATDMFSDGAGSNGDPHSTGKNCRSSSCVDINDLVERNQRTASNKTYSVSFDSYECPIESLLHALNRMNVTTDIPKLKDALRVDEREVEQMDITQYLMHMAKLGCNYKLIMTSIEQCCEDVCVDFYPGTDNLLEGVQVPLHEIFLRLSPIPNLKSILAIRNRRFHQMNVYGKIVNAIRRYPDMRTDIIYDDYIVIPQYYRNGCILIQKTSN